MVFDHPYRFFRHKRFSDISSSKQLELCIGHLENATPFCKRWKDKGGETESEFLKSNCLQILLDIIDDEDIDMATMAANAEANAAAADTRKAVALYML